MSDVDIMESFFRLSLSLFERRQITSEPSFVRGGSGRYLDSVQVRSTHRSSPVRQSRNSSRVPAVRCCRVEETLAMVEVPVQ